MAPLDPIKRFIASFQRSCERNSLAINIAINVLLVVLCLASYTFLLILYFSNGMWTRSFKYVNKGDIPPTTVVTFFGVLLTAATSGLLTRCAEHSLWNTIINDRSAPHDPKQISPDESHRQAQWTISPIARAVYVFNGQSWTLSLGGLLFFGTAILNPVLLYGVSPGVTSISTNVTTSPTDSVFAGFTPTAFEASQFPDSAMVSAALASMNNLNAPVANVCSNSSCFARAYATTLQAECVASSRNFAGRTAYFRDYLKLDDGEDVTNCSSFGDQTCITLSPTTMINFTTGPSTACSKRALQSAFDFECPEGDFAVIYGTWRSEVPDDGNGPVTVHTIDCQVSYGNATISQPGQSPPNLDRHSFVKSKSRIPSSWEGWAFGIPPGTPEENDGLLPAPWTWQHYYLTQSTNGLVSPYTFAYDVANLTLMSPMSRYLVTSDKTFYKNDSIEVARAVEANFDMATLFAFAKAPGAASVNVTINESIDIWLYDARVLSILLFPFVATILVLSKRWSVYGNDIVIGYNPHLIAQRAGEILTSLSRENELDDDVSRLKAFGPRGDYTTVSDRPMGEISLTRLSSRAEREITDGSFVERRASADGSSSVNESCNHDTEHQAPGNSNATNPQSPQGSPASLARDRAHPVRRCSSA